MKRRIMYLSAQDQPLRQLSQISADLEHYSSRIQETEARYRGACPSDWTDEQKSDYVRDMMRNDSDQAEFDRVHAERLKLLYTDEELANAAAVQPDPAELKKIQAEFGAADTPQTRCAAVNLRFARMTHWRLNGEYLAAAPYHVVKAVSAADKQYDRAVQILT